MIRRRGIPLDSDRAEQPHDGEIVRDLANARFGTHYALCTCGWAGDITTYEEAMSDLRGHQEDV